MNKFDSEAAKKEFKNLCTKVLPKIGSIKQVLAEAGVTDGATIFIGRDGYMTFDVHGSNWSMARYENDGPVKINYEYSEEISVSNSLKQEV